MSENLYGLKINHSLLVGGHLITFFRINKLYFLMSVFIRKNHTNHTNHTRTGMALFSVVAS